MKAIVSQGSAEDVLESVFMIVGCAITPYSQFLFRAIDRRGSGTPSAPRKVESRHMELYLGRQFSRYPVLCTPKGRKGTAIPNTQKLAMSNRC